MSGLFRRRKKVPSLTLPPHLGSGNALQFPTSPPPGRVIEPEAVKMAAGVKPIPPSAPPMPEPRYIQEEEVPSMPSPTAPLMGDSGLYVKVDVYQRILGEFESVKSDFSDLKTANRHLQESEYNEEESFARLRNAMKTIHDRLLSIDKTLFKPQR